MFKGPTKYSEYIQDVPKSIDYILKRVNAVTVADLQAVTNAGATTTLPINTGGITSDYFQFDTAATPTLAPGMFAWNDAYGTADLRLKGNNVTLQVGQETLARVVNKTGADLLESQYKVVRVRIASEGGAQGQRLAVVLAQGNNDPDSATTLGLVTENIANNQEGFITIFGNVNNINTTGTLQGETWVDGDVLYLSPTVPGAITKVKPVAPQHTVIIGYVVYAHNNQGKIFVKVDNGYELDELHNVLITSPANNDLLQYNSTQQVWKNVASSVAVPTPTLAQVTTAGNTTTNAITVGGLTVATNLIYTDTVNGRVGIGTTTPNVRLEVSGDVRLVGSSTSSATMALAIYNSTVTELLRLRNDGLLIINNSSNVLIGTATNAGYKLDVNGTGRFVDTIRIAQSGFLRNADITMGNTLWINASHGGIQFAFAGNNIVNFGGTNNQFFKQTQIGYGTSLITRNASLSVGGSITASTALAQGILYDGTLVAAANNDVLVGLDINPTFTNGAFTGVSNLAARIQGNTEISRTGADTQLTVARGGGASFTIQGKANSTSQSEGVNLYWTNNTWLKFVLGSSVVANFSNVGNLLVGTSTDAGYKLDVNGTGRFVNTLNLDSNLTFGANDITINSTKVFGKLAIFGTATGTSSIAIGYTASATTNAAIAIGYNAVATGANATVIGDSASSAGAYSVTIGAASLGVANTFVSGSRIGIISNVYFGSGVRNSGASVAGADYTINGSGASSNFDIAGGNITIAGGKGTGNGTPGDIIFATSTKLGVSTLTLQTLSNRIWIKGDTGNVGIGTSTPTDKFHIVDNTNGNKFARISAGGTDASAAWVAQNDQVDNVVYRVFGSAVTGSQMGQALARSASLIANLGGTGKFLIGSFSGTDLIFGTSDQARMRLVDATGNFLIGTMTDNGNKLTVSGNIDAQGYKVNNVLGYTGIFNVPTNPPGQQNIDIQGGIVVNIF